MWEKILISLIPQLLFLVSPALRDFVFDVVKQMETNAKNTDNHWDDSFVEILKVILNIKD